MPFWDRKLIFLLMFVALVTNMATETLQKTSEYETPELVQRVGDVGLERVRSIGSINHATVAEEKNRIIIQLRYNGDKTCAICLCHMSGRPVRYTPCGHVFHSKCMKAQTSGTHAARYKCALCRRNLRALLPKGEVVRRSRRRSFIDETVSSLRELRLAEDNPPSEQELSIEGLQIRQQRFINFMLEAARDLSGNDGSNDAGNDDSDDDDDNDNDNDSMPGLYTYSDSNNVSLNGTENDGGNPDPPLAVALDAVFEAATVPRSMSTGLAEGDAGSEVADPVAGPDSEADAPSDTEGTDGEGRDWSYEAGIFRVLARSRIDSPAWRRRSWRISQETELETNFVLRNPYDTDRL